MAEWRRKKLECGRSNHTVNKKDNNAAVRKLIEGSTPSLTTDTHGNLELMHHEQVMRANMENTSQCVGKYQVLLTVGKDPLYSQVVDM